MGFLFINTYELTALAGLPYIQQSAYLLGIRPYMDRKTFLVGEKRRISYQSLAETLYVEPHQGLAHSGSPSRQQLRRIIRALERAGLIAVQSSGMHLILKCLLADADYSASNKADTKPTQQIDTKEYSKNLQKTIHYEELAQKPNTAETIKPDIPHNSKDQLICLQQQFAQFWSLYPLKQDESKAWQEFAKLQPNAGLLAHMLSALHAQVKQREELELLGAWVPNWKYPSNWIAQQCWNDELITLKAQELRHANPTSHSRKKSAADLLAESCKDARFDFDFEEDSTMQPEHNSNLAPLNQYPHER